MRDELISEVVQRMLPYLDNKQLVNLQNNLNLVLQRYDEELTQRFKESIRIDDEIRKIKGLPVARYDDEKKQAYLEYPDGRREYVE